MTRLLTMLLCAAALGCDGRTAADRAAVAQAGADGAVAPAANDGDAAARQTGPAAPPTVDSIFTMAEMLARFQAQVSRRPLMLDTTAASSRDGLIARFMRAIEDSSLSALQSLRLDVSEYAHLYAPDSRFSREPYRQPPQLGWLLIEQNGLKGEARLLRRFGGRPLGYRGHRCGAPIVEGRNTLWENCTIDLGGDLGAVRLFGTILRRDDRYKFVSHANDL